MSNTLVVPISNMGFMVALSLFKTVPVSADIVGDINKVTGVGFSVESTDATAISSTSGYARPAPTVKTGKPFTVTLFKNNAGYNRISSQFHGYSTHDPLFYCDITLVFPKATGVNDAIPDYTYHGYISKFDQGDADSKSIQTYSIEFTPMEDPTVFNGFGLITGVTANPVVLTNTGGAVIVTVAGTDLSNGITVQAFEAALPVTGAKGTTTGTATSQTVSITLPAGGPKSYTIKASKDGVVWSTFTVLVTTTA